MMMYRPLLIGALLFCFACTSGSSGSSAAKEPATTDTAVSSMTEAAAPDDTIVAAAPARKDRFEQRLTQGEVSFVVTSPNDSKDNTFAIKSEGLSNRNTTFTKEIGRQQVYRAELADLNQDSYPEVYIFTRTPEVPPQGEVYAYASYRNRSFGEVYIADEPEQLQRSAQYKGGDVFELQETTLVRQFPVYTDGKASKNKNTLTYKLKMGETSYRLEAVEQ